MKLNGCGPSARLASFPILLAAGIGVLLLAPALELRPGAALAQDKKDKDKDKDKDKKKAERKAPGKKARERGSSAAKSESLALRVLGVLGSRLKDTDYYELTYNETDDRKKTTRKKVWLKLPHEGVGYWQDRSGRIQEFKEGDKIHLLGRPEEREVPGAGGTVAGIDYSFRLVRFLLGGEGAPEMINDEYEDPKDETITWNEADVDKTGAAIKVKHGGSTYSVQLDRGAQVIFRDKVADSSKLLRARALVIVRCPEKTSHPEGAKGKDAELEAFEAAEVIFVDPRIAAHYGSALSL